MKEKRRQHQTSRRKRTKTRKQLPTQQQQQSGASKAGIKRIARRAGVLQITQEVYGAANQLSRQHLDQVLRRIILYAQANGRKTVLTGDVELALQLENRTILSW